MCFGISAATSKQKQAKPATLKECIFPSWMAQRKKKDGGPVKQNTNGNGQVLYMLATNQEEKQEIPERGIKTKGRSEFVRRKHCQ